MLQLLLISFVSHYKRGILLDLPHTQRVCRKVIYTRRLDILKSEWYACIESPIFNFLECTFTSNHVLKN